MASQKDCIAAVQAAAGRELTESEVERVFELAQGRTRRYINEGMTELDAAVRAGKELGDNIRLAATVERASMIRNKVIQRALDERVAGAADPATAVRDIVKLTDAEVRGARLEFLGPFVRRLDESGLTKLMKRADPEFDRAIRRELGALQSGRPHSGPPNKLAKEAADIIHDAQTYARNRQNAAGAWIGQLDDYITFQSHDRDKMRKAGFDAWLNEITPKLSPRTFDDLPNLTPETMQDYLRGAYNALVTGMHEGNKSGMMAGFTGPGNLAKRVSASRKLIFKDADARSAYDEAFAGGNMMDVVTRSLDTAARNTALMNRWGTNPTAMLDGLLERQMTANKGNPSVFNKLKDSFTSRMMAVIDGSAQSPEGQTAASITNVVLASQTVTKLGGVVLSSIPDFAVTASTMRQNGIGVLDAMAQNVLALLPKGAGRKAVAREVATALDSTLAGVASTIHGPDITGRSAKLVELFHRVNGLEWWTGSLKSGVGMMLTSNLGKSAGRDFAALNPRLQRTLARYEITAADWNAARASAAKQADGNTHVLPTQIADPAVRSKFSTYIADQASEAMTEPDAVSRTFTTLGTQAGTAAGAAARIMFQFKSYPVTFFNRTFMREFRDAKAGDIGGMASLIISTTIMGYIAMEMKDIAKGLQPRSVRLASGEATWADGAKALFAAAKQGGGLGFYGDFLLGAPNRFGGPVTDFVVGPAFGTADDALKILQNIIQATAIRDPNANPGREALSSSIKLFRDNAGALGFVPGLAPAVLANTFYGRAALDYLIIHGLQEAVNPGYLQRYQDRIQRQEHREFMLSPAAQQLSVGNLLR